MSNRYEVTVTLRTGECPTEIVYCSSPTEAIEQAMDRWGELGVSGDVEGWNSEGD